MDLNYSLYTIPIYWIMAIAPHAYASKLVREANNNKWNNANPRSTVHHDQISKSVPSDVFAKYERAEAAHKNSMENAPLFIGAVLAGNLARLQPSFLNLALGTYLGFRVVYLAAYINTTTQKYSYLRSLLWATSTGLLFYVFVKAGNQLAL
ncbi:hypothetical protein EJ04DRAFT_52365 [Polyplosphaeria fusca]|uniref:Uncharacterized protein n=1 Tax=Polyplosphaeria fusca TaxID=682080 RepID=A0A9P4R5C6_9PLEO|nr:hypothetical protein EJ04DRAFT_52365 [Polyplosphaeria fusca]